MIDSLRNHNMYFSYPKEFNDPFDCRIVTTNRGSKTEWLQWLQNQNISFDKKREIENFINSSRFDSSKFEKPPTNEIDTQVLHCLSAVYDNLLMWSHYAENHKGICIGYEVKKVHNSPCLFFDDVSVKPYSPKIKNGAVPLIEVNYQENMPDPVKVVNKTEEAIMNFLTTKAKLWDYEKEWRLFYPSNKIQNKLISVKKNLISEIYLGAKIEKETKERVLDIIENEYLAKGFNVDVFQLSLSDKSYSLNGQKLSL